MKKESILTRIKPIRRVSFIPKRGHGVLNTVHSPLRIAKPIQKKATVMVKLAASETNVWIMDRVHSSLEFSARHMKLTDLGGRFNEFDVKLYSSAEDFSDAYIALKARVDSLDTGVTIRDNVIKGEDWLNAARFPVISFNSTSFKNISGNQYELIGNLTIGNISHTVIFNATLNGKFSNTYPKKTICGFTISGYIDRSKFQLGGDSVATGVSNEIIVAANVEFMKG
jgi:polyisoprenoid-binding protein YceI